MVNGPRKGAEWERQVGVSLSLWLTAGQRADIFARNVQSGGRFTSALKVGKAERGMPGDLMAAHVAAFAFMDLFLVECKHLASLGIEEYVYDQKGGSQLAKIIALATTQAAQAETKLEPMVIAKQNRRAAAVFVPRPVFEIINRHGRLGIHLHHHDFHRQTITMFRLDDMLTFIDPDKFIAEMGNRFIIAVNPVLSDVLRLQK